MLISKNLITGAEQCALVALCILFIFFVTRHREHTNKLAYVAEEAAKKEGLPQPHKKDHFWSRVNKTFLEVPQSFTFPYILMVKCILLVSAVNFARTVLVKLREDFLAW